MSLNEQLHDVVRNVPYNNVQALYELNGHMSPAMYGGSCLFQLKELKKKIEENGGSVRYLNATEGSLHHVAIASDNGDQFLLDPSRRQQYAIPISQALKEHQIMDVPAYPKNDKYSTVLRVTPTGPRTFKESLVLQYPDGRDEQEVAREQFAINKLTDELPDAEYDVQTTRNDKRLLVYAVFGENVLSVGMQPNGTMFAQKQGEAKLREAKKKEEFDEIFRNVAEKCQVEPRELRAYLDCAREYLKNLLE